MITPNRYSVQFMDSYWGFCTTLMTNDLQRAKKFCAAMVAFNPNVRKGLVLDLTDVLGEVAYSVNNEREAVMLLRGLMRLEVV